MMLICFGNINELLILSQTLKCLPGIFAHVCTLPPFKPFNFWKPWTVDFRIYQDSRNTLYLWNLRMFWLFTFLDTVRILFVKIAQALLSHFKEVRVRSTQICFIKFQEIFGSNTKWSIHTHAWMKQAPIIIIKMPIDMGCRNG